MNQLLSPQSNYKKYAFIDETGSYGFNFEKKDVSSYFIITAVIVNESSLNNIENEFERIRDKYFQKGEMKSSKVSSNDIRRIKILEDLSKLDFSLFALIVNKKKINTESGLGFKKTFIKFLNELVHAELYKAFPRLEIIADEQGTKEFMVEFKKYVHNKHTPDLFEQYDFGFNNSKESLLIQLADFIGGTIALGVENSRKSNNFSQFLKILKSKITFIKDWPHNYDNYYLNAELYRTTKFQRDIATLAIRLANEYIKKHSELKEYDINNRIKFLQFLEFNLRFGKPDRYISTNEIIANLNCFIDKKINKYYLRAKIVAKLRDDGILIASSPYGYKLPVSEKELYDFVNHSHLIIMPMLNRLNICRNQIKLATQNNLDILDKDEYQKVKMFFDCYYDELQ